ENEWAAVGARAARDFRDVLGEYGTAVRSSPGLAEPFVIISPQTCDTSSPPTFFDVHGAPLPMAIQVDPAGCAAVAALAQKHTIAWAAGRLVDLNGSLMLVPCSAAIQRGAELLLRRIR